MLQWDEVRRLIVQCAAPAVQPLGFGSPGRTMRRWRADFVDVIDFRCGKWNDRAEVSFGCGLRRFVKQNPKPWDCIFYFQPHRAWPDELLAFKAFEEEQIAALNEFAPLFAAEASRWFGLLPDVATARAAVDRNTCPGPTSIAMFNVPSPAYHEAVQKLKAIMAAGQDDDPTVA